MRNFKSKLAKRILAFVLSGTMVISGMTTSEITAFASQPSDDTEGYYEEVIDSTDSEEEDEADEKDDKKVSSDETVDEAEQKDETVDETEQKDETVDETEQNDDEQVTETKTSDDEQTSEMTSSSSAEKEEPKEDEENNTEEDLEATEMTVPEILDSEELNALANESARAGGKKIDVWDFGATLETNTTIYNNHITSDLWDADTNLGDNGTFTVSETTKITFGDVTVAYANGDRVYKKTGKTNGDKSKEFDDFTSAGYYYCGGTGGSNRRYITIDNVTAGDKIYLYAGLSNSVEETLHFDYTGTDGTQNEERTIEKDAKKLTFIANCSGSYKIWTDAPSGGGKPTYYRLVRIPTVDVSGTIDLGGNTISGYSLKFVNQTDRTLPDVVADLAADNSFTAQLAGGYTYRVLLTGVTGYGFVTKDGADKVTINDTDIATGKTGLKFTVAAQETYVYSGTIEGFASDYDVSRLRITMTPTKDFDSNPVELTIDTATMTFSARLQPDVKYIPEIEGVNDYMVKSPAEICNEDKSDFTGKTFTVELKPMYDVIGGFIGLADGVTVTSLNFTNVEDNYAYTATVANGSYSILLRDGEYLANATASTTGYTTKTHVVVDGGMVSQDLFFTAPANNEPIAYVPDIYVGYPKQQNNYDTVNDAVKAASLMKKDGNARTSAERVTIHIAPGTYREQIIVSTPYITFVNDTDEEVLLTWYYAVGYEYYSVSGGFYNAESAYDKYSKGTPDRWGCTVRLYDATGFRAEGITFENSFNRYITDEELEDGVSPTGTLPSRNYNANITSRAATERAAAMVIEPKSLNVEFYNCKFYGSQDTLYTSGGPIYFKNCLIEGQTDYIYGSGSCVFDACELSWKGYSADGLGGYITANSPKTKTEDGKTVRADDDLGYLFRNCTVTANTGLPVVAGYFGRPWGATAQVIFMNTKLQNTDLIAAAGWTAMSSVNPAEVHIDFCEYNTTSLDGKTVDTSKRTNDQMTDAEAAAVNVSAYFGDWTPVYYTEDATGTVTFSDEPTLSDNGDINVPNPGHTLTVNYALSGNDAENDVSTIKWYIMDDVNGTNATIAKISTASVDKTYKIAKAASGKYIKVEVTPETIDGRKGEMKSVMLPTVIGNEYVDPSSGSNITVGDGINIYLAGDSTVKDYSANGMWNGGKQSEDLGSWGEYLQSFFDSSEVTVQNFAQGGRSSRSFINDDTTTQKKFSVIEANISEGDYLLIQFGHNDSSTLDNKKDVYTPIGAKGSDGKYPYTPGTKNSEGKYPDYYKYTDGTINWISDGTQGTATYCWFLQQYVDMALEKGAIPVIMSPVARMQYDSTSKTNKKHHADEHNTSSYYWEAAKQVYEDNKDRGALFIDAYGLTTDLFNGAYADGGEARGKEIMSISDGTHNNKLGGMVEAMLVAEAIQNMDTPLAYAVKAPTQVSGMTTKEKTVFSIDSKSNFIAYEQKFTGNKETAAYTNDTFTTKSDYWTNYGTTKLTSIGTKSGQLADSNVSDKVVAAPKATSAMSDADGSVTVTLTSATEGAKIYYTDDGVTNPKNSDGTVAEGAKLYDATNKIVLQEDTTIKAFATAEGKTASKVVTFTFSTTPNVEAPTANVETGTIIASGAVIKLTSTTSGAQIRYTMGNGSKVADPTAYSPLYDAETGITITNSVTIKAVAVKNGVLSEVATFTYTVDPTLKATAAKPTASVASGTILALKEKITLRTATKDAKIYYTTDGTTNPTTASTLYSGAITVTEELVQGDKLVIKAIAVKENMNNSDVVTFTYTIDKDLKLATANPVADPQTGSNVKVGDTVTLSSSTTGAKIVYTTDGKAPSATSESAVPSPVRFTITESMVSNNKVTIKAIAISADADREASEVVTITYNVGDNSQGSGDSDDEEPDDEIRVSGAITDSKKFTVYAPSVVYNKKEQVVAPVVTYTPDKGKPQVLSNGVHYTYNKAVNKEYKEPGTYTLKVCGLGDITGTTEVTYTIYEKTNTEKKDIKKAKFKLDSAQTKNAVYTGTYVIVDVEDTDGIGEANYAVAYSNNVNAGKATVTITGKNDYYGTKTLTYTIKKASMANVEPKIGESSLEKVGKNYTATEQTYYGNAITLSGLNFVLKSGEDANQYTHKLNSKNDYILTYKNNNKAGTAKITVKGNNNFTGSLNISFDIKAANLEELLTKEGTVIDTLEYSAKGPRLKEINCGGLTLKEGTHYKVTNYKAIAGTEVDAEADLAISGAGAYKGQTVSVKAKVQKGRFYVSANLIVDAKKAGGDTLDLEKLKKAVKVTDASGTKVKAEVYDVAFDGTKNELTIKPADTDSSYKQTTVNCFVGTKISTLKQNKALPKEKIYNGEKPAVLTKAEIVEAFDGSLTANDFTITSYKNNTKKGNATVTITANMNNGKFYGTRTVKFKIVLPDTKVGEVGEIPDMDPGSETHESEESSKTDESKGTEESSKTDESSSQF